MTPDEWRTLRTALETLRETPRADQCEVLERTPNGPVRDALAQLIHQEIPDDFLQPGDPGRSSAIAAHFAERALGSIIGGYRLEAVVAVGGMGTVYEAVPENAPNDRVALKLLHLPLSEPALVRRFQNERRALARLHHPHIARLIDGGVTERGAGWLAMHLIRGVPIDRYCEAQDLRPRERVRLLCRFAHAVQHAHQNLVLHRDLKPANMLVDAQGTPFLVDFGIARIDDDQAATQTTWSAFTPAYASPEQQRREALTPTSEVYSLGVVLYQLLTDRLPGSTESEEQPEPATPAAPSRVLGRAAAATTRRFVAGDVDTILLRALDPDSGRRYATVQALIEDLERVLENRPIRAKRNAWTYRVGKFVQRNTVTVSLTTALCLAVLAGLGVTRWSLGIARTDRDRALQNAVRAERIADFFDETLASDDAPDHLRAATTVRALLDRAAARVDSLAPADPQLEAMLRRRIGGRYARIAHLDRAIEQLRRADTLLGANTATRESAERVLCLVALATAQARSMNESAAYESWQSARALNALHDPPPVAPATIELGLGLCAYGAGDTDEGRHLCASALAMGADNDDDERPADYLRWAKAALTAGQIETARQATQGAADLLARDWPDGHPQTLRMQSRVARAAGDLDQAESYLRRTIAQTQEPLALIQARLDLADLLNFAERPDDAEPLFAEVTADVRATLPKEHYVRALALDRHARFLVAHGRPAAAVDLLEEVSTTLAALLDADHPVAQAAQARWQAAHDAARARP